MKAVVQRVSRAVIRDQDAGDREIHRIGKGFLVLAGFGHGDCSETIVPVADKIASLRVFPDETGKMSRDLLAVGGEILVVSQFTLYADCRRGTRPSFQPAADRETAERGYAELLAILSRTLGPERVRNGPFGAMLSVELVNDGPVTICLDSAGLGHPERN